MTENALKLFQQVAQHAKREKCQAMGLKPDSRLDQTEARDARLFCQEGRHRLALRMLKRIDYRQKAA
eukprot:2902317-Alexandrium_andersonii.AAC.1